MANYEFTAEQSAIIDALKNEVAILTTTVNDQNILYRSLLDARSYLLAIKAQSDDQIIPPIGTVERNDERDFRFNFIATFLRFSTADPVDAFTDHLVDFFAPNDSERFKHVLDKHINTVINTTHLNMLEDEKLIETKNLEIVTLLKSIVEVA